MIDAGCAHAYIVVGQRKPRDMPKFHWVNTVLGNLKTAICGAHKAFKFCKYASRYLGAFSYRFNRRFNLHDLVRTLFADALGSPPKREYAVKGVAEFHTESAGVLSQVKGLDLRFRIRGSMRPGR